MFRLILFGVGFLAFASGQCPPNSLSLEMNDTICYSFHSTLKKFAEAQFQCNSFGAQLVSLKNEYTNVFITHYANLIFDDIVFFWTGGSKLRNPSEFEWSNGEKLEYNRLKNGQSNGSCLAAEINEGNWKPENCFAELSFVCEFSAGKNVIPKGANSIDTGVPTPANTEIETTTHLYLFEETTSVTTPEAMKSEQPSMDRESATDEPSTPAEASTTFDSTILVQEKEQSTTVETTSATPTCPSGWELYNEKCYKIHETPLSWSDAEAACQAEDSHLLSIHDEQENDFIREFGHLNTNETVCNYLGHFWIGFNKLSSTEYKWSDESEAIYTNWLKDQPDNYVGIEKCVELDTNENCTFGWNDNYCNSPRQFICKQAAEYGTTNIASSSLAPTNKVFEEQTTTTTPEAKKFEPMTTAEEQSTIFETTSATPSCPSGWELYNEKCYKLHVTPLPWSEAEAACQAENSHLLSIHDEKENEFIHELGNWNTNKTVCTWTGNLWLGFSNLESSEYVWSDGSEPTFTNWLEGQPDNSLGKERCAELVTTQSCILGWNDYICTTTKKFICKKAAEYGSSSNSASSLAPTNKDFEEPTISTTPEAKKLEPTTIPEASTPQTPISHKPTCPSGWELYNERCYKIYDSEKSWSEAEAACKTDSAHLASIHDEQESQFIYELGNLHNLEKPCKPWTRNFWIGLNAIASTEYTWSDGSEKNYTTWINSQPDNRGGNEKCGEILTTVYCEVGWNDNDCDSKSKFLCKKAAEFPVNLVTATSSSPSSIQDQQFSVFSNTEEPSTVSL